MTWTPCPQCGGDGKVEERHPLYGTYSCPEPTISVRCEACDGTGETDLAPMLIDVLTDVEGFLDNQADAEIDPVSGRTIGNAAMRLLSEVRDVLKRLEDAQP